MFDKNLKLIASALIAAIVGAVCACQSDDVPQPLAVPTPPPQTASEPYSFVGTVPVPRIDERAVTPTETVGATPN